MTAAKLNLQISEGIIKVIWTTHGILNMGT